MEMTKSGNSLIIFKILDIHSQIDCMLRSIRCELQTKNITFTEYRILTLIDQNMMCSKISKKLDISSAAVSKSVFKLLKKEYVSKEIPKEKRTIALKLTYNGKMKCNQIRNTLENKFSMALDKLSIEERIDLEKGLMTLERLFIHIYKTDHY